MCEASFVASQKQLRPDLSEIKFPPPTTRPCRDTRCHKLPRLLTADSDPIKTLPGLDFPLRPFLRMSERAAVHPLRKGRVGG
ncbi:hypothetical protein CEXT_85791 [Caerostris extrusa]|uniref:Uncharacterized protein n=1 Tax=Caerostris extrusa TaxID=172846 RepID=A0AAV4VFA0_CAEEX|nr:hypothetical protein CEXT_85791 [Caerostris extrusa]